MAITAAGKARATGTFSGGVRPLTIGINVAQLHPALNKTPKGLDDRARAGATELGAAWKKTSKGGNAPCRTGGRRRALQTADRRPGGLRRGHGTVESRPKDSADQEAEDQSASLPRRSGGTGAARDRFEGRPWRPRRSALYPGHAPDRRAHHRHHRLHGPDRS